VIRLVKLKGFKRFGEIEFNIPGHIVLAGPNNTGKTTLLQAIAAWELGFRKWREMNDLNPRKNGYRWQELERLAFSAVAVRSFDMLWKNRQRQQPFEIGLQVDGLPLVTMEFKFQSGGSMRVRPMVAPAVTAQVLQHPNLQIRSTFIPAMSGLAREERRLADDEAIDDLLAQGRPGEILRNLMVKAHRDEDGWRLLNSSVGRLFNYELLPPQAGAQLVCEYRQRDVEGAPKFDIASAGSGFLQVLLLLTLLLTQHQSAAAPNLVLLIDEPDAHLHVILQRTIYGELRSVASSRNAQLFVATHSEIIVNNVEARELYLMYGVPRLVKDEVERRQLTDSFGALSHSDILEADGARGVLYTEDFTDLDVLQAFARALGDEHALRLLTCELLTKSSKAPLPDGLGEFSPKKHWDMLKLINEEMPALELLDGDNSRNQAPDRVDGSSRAMQRIRWRRYEVESYLVHPAALQRFVEKRLGGVEVAIPPVVAMLAELARVLKPEFVSDPMHPEPLVETYFKATAVSKTLLPALLQAAGLNNLPKRDYFEIAALFQPQEVPAEIIERLAQIKQAFGVAHV
jgi:AAA domain, putative AbiEii toxin, Type IV TA system